MGAAIGGGSVIRTKAHLAVVLGLDGSLSHGSSHGIGSVELPSERVRTRYPLWVMGPIYTSCDSLSLPRFCRANDCIRALGCEARRVSEGSPAWHLPRG